MEENNQAFQNELDFQRLRIYDLPNDVKEVIVKQGLNPSIENLDDRLRIIQENIEKYNNMIDFNIQAGNNARVMILTRSLQYELAKKRIYKESRDIRKVLEKNILD
jgi:SpoU rRNA methylase family enzyme